MRRRNVFIVGLDELNRKILESLPDSDDYNFIQLLDLEKVKGADRYPIEKWAEQANTKLDLFDGPIDGIIGFWDFPVSGLVFLLATWYNQKFPTLDAVVRCEHKYLSRLEQKKAVPEHVPGFTAFNPFDSDPRGMIDMDYPFWVKPIKSWGSQLGFKVESDEDFDHAVEKIREGIGRFAEPFNWFLKHVDLPEEAAHVDGHWCMAEEIIGGRQCTIAGYNYESDVITYGLIDSINYPGTSCFQHYEYPSRLPKEAEERMAAISKRIMDHIGFRNSPFNIEYFFDRDTDEIHLLEINTRISQSHSDLFRKVDGVTNHSVLVDLAVGNEPRLPEKESEGSYAKAAKFHLRVFEDGEVTRVPTEEDIRKAKDEVPETEVLVQCEQGMRLSELHDQDSYSYRIGIVYVGGDNIDDLMERISRVVEILDFRVDGEHVSWERNS